MARSDIGECIPENLVGIVVKLEDRKFIGEHNYYVHYRYDNGKTCSDILTKHDYLALKVGDSVSRQSARPFYQKVFGEDSWSGMVGQLFKTGLFMFMFIFILLALAFVWGFDCLFEKFLERKQGKFIIDAVYGNPELDIKGFSKIPFTFLATISVYVFVLAAFFEMMDHHSPYCLALLVTLGYATIVLLYIVIMGDRNKFFYNLRIASLGTLSIVHLSFMFYFIGDMKLSYMLEFFLAKLLNGASP